MEQRSEPPQTPAGRPALRVPLAEAAAKIQTQINEGEALIATLPRTQPELDDAQEKESIWSDYNRELLVQLFTSTAVADEYSEFAGGFFFIKNRSFAELVQNWKKDVQSSLTRLRSVYRRLELYNDPRNAIPESRTPTERGDDIFVVHGQNKEAKETVARFLEKLSLSVTILHEQPDMGRTIIEKFEDNASVGYAVVLLTGDDVGALRSGSPDLQPRARQNVVLELGYFLGSLGRTHVCALCEDGVEVPSDLSGLLYVPFDSAGAWKFKLATEIKAAGIEVDLNRVVT